MLSVLPYLVAIMHNYGAAASGRCACFFKPLAP